MSYSIIYGRQFVKTTKGIIPMILSGSNNCTEFIQGREVLERNWYPMTLSNKDKRIAIPAGELLERICEAGRKVAVLQGCAQVG